MNRIINIVAIALLLVVLPLRGVAALTVGFCASGHQESATQAGSGHGHHAPQEHRSEPRDKPDCSICAEHCSSGSCVVPAALETPAGAERSGRIVLGEPFAAGFVPDHLDPPPLAL